MKTFPVAEAKTHLSSILKEVEGGSEIAISFGKKKEIVAVLIPYDAYKKEKKRKLGVLKGKMEVIFADDFSLSDVELLRS